MTGVELRALKRLRRMLAFDGEHFSPDFLRQPVTLKTEKEVLAFIESQTQLWRNSWVFPLIDLLLQPTSYERSYRLNEYLR